MPISETAKIYSNVKLGEDVVIEDFCIIGCPPIGKVESEMPETVIGDGARIRAHTVIYAGNKIGKNFQTGNKANIRELNSIGDNVSIGTLSCIEHSVKIGDGVRIHTQAFIPEFSEIESGAWIGPNVVLTNAKYPQTPTTKEKLAGPIIRKGAMLGANATVLPGVVVGEQALVGAGSVVTRDVLAKTVVGGNPAQTLKQLDEIQDYEG